MEEETLDLRRYLDVILRWWWFVLLGPAVGILFAFLLTSRQVPQYEARATLLVQQTGESAVPTLGDIQASQRLAATYQQLITTSPLLEEVIEREDLPYSVSQLRPRVGASVVRDTQLLGVSARHTDPTMAARIANALAEAFIERMQENRLAEIARLQAAAQARGITDTRQLLETGLASLGSLSIVEPAAVPTLPVGAGRLRLSILLAVMVGGFLSVLGAFGLEYFNDRLRSSEEVERVLGVPGLGLVVQWRRSWVEPFVSVVRQYPRSTVAEMYRQVRANLQFTIGAHAPAKLFMVSSAMPREGKTTTVANLAVAMAQTGSKVILVDGDMRHSEVHKWFNLPNDLGLSNLLAYPDRSVDEALQETGVEGLRVIAAGPNPPNPAELLGTARMGTIVKELKERADLVLFDAVPMLVVADGAMLVSHTDGAILVTSAKSSRPDDMRKVIDTVRRAEVPVLGVIVNRAQTRRFGYGYGYHRYPHYYGHYYAGEGQDGSGDGLISVGGSLRWLRRRILRPLRLARRR
ncbi:MAG: polysaccharide biosynthesis tyrosine autokinase [Chloroflexi bacterium]|nr:polysaccharide biosynthesis tyrosine autokinase [Chloroflexota bacterium]